MTSQLHIKIVLILRQSLMTSAHEVESFKTVVIEKRRILTSDLQAYADLFIEEIAFFQVD